MRPNRCVKAGAGSTSGHELRPEQVDANRIQGSELCGDDEHPPAWICGETAGNIDDDLRRCAPTWCLPARHMPTLRFTATTLQI